MTSKFQQPNMEEYLKEYLSCVKENISTIMKRTKKETLTYDMFDDNSNTTLKLQILKEKQKHMKMGEIMQMVLGIYGTFEDLKVGHESGLDIISYEREIVIELKYRTNTDNSSSRKANLDKLAKFKKENPSFLCVYGCINDSTKEKTITGKIEKIIHNDQEIHKYVGHKLLDLILEENKDIIIEQVKQILADIS